MPSNTARSVFTFHLSCTCMLAGTPEHARTLIPFLTPCAGLQMTLMSLYYFGAYDLHLGVLHAQAGDEQAGIAHLKSALQQHRAFNARPWVAVTEHALGCLLLRTGGDRIHGEALLASARDSARALGMTDPASLITAAHPEPVA